MLDLWKWVGKLRQRSPNLAFDLETITRDPQRVPVFTRKYWATFDDAGSPLPGRDLARVLEIVRKNPPKHPLPRITGLTTQQQAALEDENNRKSIDYARRNLEFR